jgi:hypothetical protein
LVKRKRLLPARPSVVVAGTSVAAGGCFASRRRPPQIDDLGKARHRLGIFPVGFKIRGTHDFIF